MLLSFSASSPGLFRCLSLLRAVIHSNRRDSAYLLLTAATAAATEARAVLYYLLASAALATTLGSFARSFEPAHSGIAVCLSTNPSKPQLLLGQVRRCQTSDTVQTIISSSSVPPSLYTVSPERSGQPSGLSVRSTALHSLLRWHDSKHQVPSESKRQSTRRTPPLDSHIVISFLQPSNVHWSVDLDCVLRLRIAQST